MLRHTSTAPTTNAASAIDATGTQTLRRTPRTLRATSRSRASRSCSRTSRRQTADQAASTRAAQVRRIARDGVHRSAPRSSASADPHCKHGCFRGCRRSIDRRRDRMVEMRPRRGRRLGVCFNEVELRRTCSRADPSSQVDFAADFALEPDRVGGAGSRSITAIVPPPSRGSIEARPPWSAAICATIDRPRPDPGSVRALVAR